LNNNELQNGFYAYSIISPHVTSREDWIKEWNKVQLPNIKSRIAVRTPSLLRVANKTKSQSTSKLYV